ncbi:hypothetical protein OU798_19720 [Prolixibacteraceae bacterium Z1-6]|uniref:Porin n=1 Tax=Draconibacterium aestuarii TaxID=2998507 RepID=A0A9X3FH67_9BACT|nr:hypothetical protein [Prolixibacteraceae bacterium Z1-6]
MKRLAFLLLAMLCIVTMTFSQTSTEDFKPNGKPLALLFTHYTSAFSDGEMNPSFGITRAYLGYEYNFSPEFYAKVVMDVGDPKVGAFDRVAYLKNAYVQYKKGNFKADFGMISTKQFKISEKIWGFRYIEKSFQDAYGMNSSADYGMSFDYKFNDFISVDFSVINGEGYKVLQSDDFVRPGLGITVNPVKNITARVFGDYMGDENKQQSLATFLAYTGEKLTLAGEYNYQKNVDMQDGYDYYGPSFYAIFKSSDKLKIFGRFDELNSSTPDGEEGAWNLEDDGKLFMAGVEINPLKGVKVAPNFRFWDTADNDIPNTSYLYLNLELKF